MTKTSYGKIFSYQYSSLAMAFTHDGRILGKLKVCGPVELRNRRGAQWLEQTFGIGEENQMVVEMVEVVSGR